VSVYWLTGTAGSAARIYYEGARTWGQARPKSPVPTAVAVFPNDLTIRPLAERDHNVVHWAEFSRGGHFAAMEAPDLLISDVRDFFRQFR
jgi:epoxide hydrolase